MVTLAQIEQLMEGKLDAGLIRPSIDLNRFGSIRLAVDRLVAAVPSTHPLATKEVIRIKDFHRQPFIGHSPIEAKYFFDITSELFRRHGVEPVTVQSLAQPHTMLSMVRAGLGVAIVANLVRRHSVDAHIAFKELQFNARPPSIEMFLIWRRDRQTPALENLLRNVKEREQ
jgi:DNA-binding transcriptional LysR family regulator